MYLRLYPKKNNTIFYTQKGSLSYTEGLINTGGNPIMQLMEGNFQSELVFQFDINADLYNKIQNNNSNIRLYIWDAGNLPDMKQSDPKTLQLFKNDDDFIEGIGYEFNGRFIKVSNSCYKYRDDLNNVWSTKNLVIEKLIDRWHDDIIFNIDKTFITQGLNTFFVKYKSPSVDTEKELAKFLHSNKTRTIKIPYLELDINDEIIDSRNNFYSNKINRIYLLNEFGLNFSSTPTFKLLDDLKTDTGNTYNVVNENAGVYYVDIDANILTNEFYYDSWYIGTEEIYRSLITVIDTDKPKSQINNMENINFYPTTKYQHDSVMWGDVLFMRIIINSRSQINTQNYQNFEWRLMCDNGFEMQPWRKVESYKEELFFKLNSVFLFPELGYEVQCRLSNNGAIHTSNQVYRFKVKFNSSTQLEHINASPYFNRDYYLPKQMKRII